MRMVTGIIGCALLVFAILHAFIPNHALYILIYGTGAFFAFLTLRLSANLFLVRVFAIGTTAAMFFYFAGFFRMTQHFTESWHSSGAALEGIGMLLAGFAMIPVLSCFSCMLKADCREHMLEHMQEHKKKKQAEQKRRAFFSVPDSVQEQSIGS